MRIKPTLFFVASLALLVVLGLCSFRSRVDAKANNHLRPSNVGYWESIFMIATSDNGFKSEKKYISQVFRACYPEYDMEKFKSGFSEEVMKVCALPTCRVTYISENSARSDEIVQKWHKEWSAKGYKKLHYGEPESIYYRECNK